MVHKLWKLALLSVAAVITATPQLALAATVREAQWHLGALNISSAQAISRGNSVVVAVVDSGVDASHPDLAGHILAGKSFGAASSLSAQEDTDGHGTAMAGLIAAQGGGENHALGIAPGAMILPLRVGTNAGAGSASSDFDAAAILQAIRWAADNGAKVINISIASGGAVTDDEKSAIAYALSKDAVVVVGAGNADTEAQGIGSLALVPGVVVVNATDRDGTLWSESFTGPQVSLSAPGVDIVSTKPLALGSKSGFTIGSGTSNSTAIVSGAAALIRSKYPDLKAPDVINRLISTADEAGNTGRDNLYGFGRLDIVKSLTASVTHVSANPLGEPVSTAITPATNASKTTPSSGGNPLTPQALAGLVIFGLIIISPVVLVVRARLRKRKLIASAVAAQTQPIYNPLQPQSTAQSPSPTDNQHITPPPSNLPK